MWEREASVRSFKRPGQYHRHCTETRLRNPSLYPLRNREFRRPQCSSRFSQSLRSDRLSGQVLQLELAGRRYRRDLLTTADLLANVCGVSAVTCDGRVAIRRPCSASRRITSEDEVASFRGLVTGETRLVLRLVGRFTVSEVPKAPSSRRRVSP